MSTLQVEITYGPPSVVRWSTRDPDSVYPVWQSATVDKRVIDLIIILMNAIQPGQSQRVIYNHN
jgi:hypothetical protein